MTLLHGDCLELMKDIPDGSVDMVLCDMPYATTRNSWDIPIPLEQLWEQYNRITKNNSAILLFFQMPFTVDLVNSNRNDFRYEWIVQKSQGTGFLNANRMPLKAHENILVFYKKLPTYNPQYSYGVPYTKKRRGKSTNYGKFKLTSTDGSSGRRFPIDVLKFAFLAQQSRTQRLHPTAKPVELLEYLIKTYTNTGETVLDNCMGSGSTGVAFTQNGKSIITEYTLVVNTAKGKM